MDMLPLTEAKPWVCTSPAVLPETSRVQLAINLFVFLYRNSPLSFNKYPTCSQRLDGGGREPLSFDAGSWNRLLVYIAIGQEH